jgi:hypothetical protein
MCLSFNAVTVLCALLIEAGFGYPASLLDRIKHPVVWMGALIESLDRRLNHPSLQEAKRRRNGWIALLLLLAASVLPAIAVQSIMLQLPGPIALIVLACLASTLIALSEREHERIAHRTQQLLGEVPANGHRNGRPAVKHDRELRERGADHAAPDSDVRTEIERRCYICKQPYAPIHHFYDQLCPPCAAMTASRRCRKYFACDGSGTEANKILILVAIRSGSEVPNAR